MAVQLSDIIEPTIFADRFLLLSTTLSEYWDSGVVSEDGQFREFAGGKGRTFHVPHWNDLDDVGDQLGGDTNAAAATPANINQAEEVACKHYRSKGWQAFNILADVEGSDPMSVVVQRTGAWWAREYQRILVATMNGLIADNDANNGGDMTLQTPAYDAAPGAGTLGNNAYAGLTADVVIQAKGTAGDAAYAGFTDTPGNQGSGFVGIAMHSKPYHDLERQNLIQFIPNARGEIAFRTFLGMRIIVDDGMPQLAGVNDPGYISAIFGAGAFAWGAGTPRVPVEVDRNPRAGGGYGQEELWTRSEFMLHPRGFACTPVANTNATGLYGLSDADLALPASWTRVFDRKHIRLAFIRHN